MRLQTNAVANYLRRFTGEARAAGSGGGKEVLLVNLTTLPIGDAELRTAFAVSESMLWFRALMQTLEVRRQESVDAAASATVANNPIRMAAAVGAAQILGEVITDLHKLRKRSVNE